MSFFYAPTGKIKFIYGGDNNSFNKTFENALAWTGLFIATSNW